MRRLWLVVALFTGCVEPVQPTEACHQMLVCFLGDEEAEKLGKVADGRYANFAAARDELRQAYGEGGTCYDGDQDAACNERCLCVLRELCSDYEARKIGCVEGVDYVGSESRCCNLDELRAFEDSLELDPDSGEGDETCEVAQNRRVPPLEDMCVPPEQMGEEQ